MTGDGHWGRARAAWDSRTAALAMERDSWRRVAFAALGLAAVAVGFGIWAAVRSEYIPYIVALDEVGRTRPMVAPRAIRDWPDAAVRHEVAAYLRDWRSVSTDPAVTRGRLRRVQLFLESGSAADRKTVAWARDPETSPFAVAETATVDVEVGSVVLVGGRSWLASWTEIRRGRATGAEEARRRYQGTFVLGRRRITDADTLMENPLGMVVEDFDIVRLR